VSSPEPSGTADTTAFRPDESFARVLDADDPLAGYRERFCIPQRADGEPAAYFCGNSLGLQPRGVRAALEQELEDWSRLAVDAHFRGRTPWLSYHEVFRDSGARLVGAEPGEVVMMNGLTANLHLMMVSFYRPTDTRYKILIEDAAFPSDTYAVKTQLRFHGHDPDDALILARPRPGESTLRHEDLEAVIERHGDEIALVMLPGVQYYTGQAFDIARITRAAKRRGCRVGWDLAHAAGNLLLRLHDWDVDFAVWCSYKYLNAGPGAVGGCFVHATHATADLPRFAGWWGNDPATRFRMHLEPEFVPRPGADGWQLSNPPILALAPLRASMEIFDEVGMEALRAKSVRLTAYLECLLDRLPRGTIRQITPRDPGARGCQLSLHVEHGECDALFAELEHAGFVCDTRKPDVIRVAPVPLYNTFHEVWRLVRRLETRLGGS
jgi:kynureninase